MVHGACFVQFILFLKELLRNLKSFLKDEIHSKRGATQDPESGTQTGHCDTSADCDTLYTIFLSLCTQSADAKDFRGTGFQSGFQTLDLVCSSFEIYLLSR